VAAQLAASQEGDTETHRQRGDHGSTSIHLFFFFSNMESILINTIRESEIQIYHFSRQRLISKNVGM
jgi:hypothetical protein